MNLESLSSADLRRILSLIEKKEAVHAELARVESQLAELKQEKGTVTARKPGRVAARVKGAVVPAPVSEPARPVKGAPVTKSEPAEAGKSTLKEAIFEVLALAGEAGESVKDIAGKLGITTSHAHVWFSTAGKKTGQIHKVKPGTYRLAVE